MTLVRHVDGKDFHWGCSLAGNEVEGFQWNLALETIVEDGQIYDVVNRGWQPVGPAFETRSEGSRYLGFSGPKKDSSAHWDRLIEEYHGLFSDEISTRLRGGHHSYKKFGRPSQGRSERLQFSATPELRRWLGEQVKPGENISLVVFKLLESLKERKER